MNEEQQRINVKTYWGGKVLKETKSHFLKYMATKDDLYFEQNCYLPLLTLANTAFNLVVLPKSNDQNRYIDKRNDFLIDAVALVVNKLHFCDWSKDVYGYFFKIMRNDMVVKMMALYKPKRDIRKTTNIDGMSVQQRRTLEEEITINEVNSNGSNDYDATQYVDSRREILRSYLNNRSTPYAKHFAVYRDFLNDWLDGKVNTPDIGSDIEFTNFIREYLVSKNEDKGHQTAIVVKTVTRRGIQNYMKRYKHSVVNYQKTP